MALSKVLYLLQIFNFRFSIVYLLSIYKNIRLRSVAVIFGNNKLQIQDSGIQKIEYFYNLILTL